MAKKKLYKRVKKGLKKGSQATLKAVKGARQYVTSEESKRKWRKARVGIRQAATEAGKFRISEPYYTGKYPEWHPLYGKRKMKKKKRRKKRTRKKRK